MIVTQFYTGQGLGNQLWVYAVCRTVAQDKGVSFGIQAPERFKGRAFMKPAFGERVDGQLSEGPSPVLPLGVRYYFVERKVVHPETGSDVTPFDPRLAEIPDSTKIDGIFQAEQYILHRKAEIAVWMNSILSLEVPEDVCVISFRGGEYQYHPELMLPTHYYRRAMRHVLDDNPKTQFVVVTEDPRLARSYFDDVRILAGKRFVPPRQLRIKPTSRAIGRDFTWVQRAPALILSNSSFSWWGAWTNRRAAMVVGPKYWARHNVSDGYWAQGDSLTQGWSWMDREGCVHSFHECARELESFRTRHPEFSSNPQ